ncbi:MAG TPA: thiamine-phosphate kinase [Pyrinomonadaceae bacterium]|nr:thiamine-phosphate kinase [Pyrinomonadaceae bacterium]
MNEFDFINKLRRRVESSASSFIPHPSTLVRGIGDDAAVFKAMAGNDVVVSTDLLVEDVDFRRDTTRPELLGHKALAVSLSDVAAMGARPRWALLSIGVPDAVWNSEFLDSFYSGFFELAARYGVTLVGGDVSRTPDRIVIDSILIGETPKAGAVFRSGAAPGDQIFVTGYLGDAAAGLRLIERGARLPLRTDQSAQANSEAGEHHRLEYLLLRQLQPEPRVGWGLLLGEQQLASAMIDISDGLSSDLNHLCAESKVGALIDAAGIPIDPLVTELSGRRALDPLMLALHGGEDFELLFTVKPQSVARLPKKVDGVSVCRIGEITNEPGKVHVTEKDRIWNLEAGGFDHFNSKG